MTFSLRSLVDGLVFLYGLFVWTPRVEGICVVLNLLMSTQGPRIAVCTSSKWKKVEEHVTYAM
jgi:hypothetical protein